MAQEQTLNSPLEALGFNSLNDTTHLYKPAASSSTSSQTYSTDPGLVVICSWAFAQDKHIAKYLTWYQQIYPSSRILVLKSSIHNMMWRPERWQGSIFEPAVHEVQDYLRTVGSSKSRILLHLFSNGGAHTAVQLAQFYEQSSSGAVSTPMLPLDAMVFDSSPGQPNPTLGTKALVQGLPKSPLLNMIGPALVRATIFASFLPQRLGLAEGALSKLWRVLNDTKGPFLKNRVPRTYIFSDADEVMDEEDVKLHAQQAIQALEAAGSTQPAEYIRREEFRGTAHVNHMLKYPERYWSIVQDTWRAAPG